MGTDGRWPDSSRIQKKNEQECIKSEKPLRSLHLSRHIEWRSEGGRACEEEEEESERSAICPSVGMTLAKVSFLPSSALHKYIQHDIEGEKVMKGNGSESTQRGVTDRDNRVRVGWGGGRGAWDRLWF